MLEDSFAWRYHAGVAGAFIKAIYDAIIGAGPSIFSMSSKKSINL